MRLPRKPGSKTKEEPSPEDTQEMFAAGQVVEDPEPEAPVEDEDLLEDEEAVEAIEDEAGLVDDEEFEEEEWEDEDWEEDEPTSDEDSGEESPDDPEAESKEESEPGPDHLAEVKARLVAAGVRLKGFWLAGLKKVGDIRLPNHELDGQKVLIVSGVIAILLMVGAAGYLIGKGTGEDIDSARLEGEFAGRKAGAVEGATKGYAAGFKKGRDIAFKKAYAASYRRNYRRAYEEAGMDPPKAKNIQVPEP